VWFIGRNDTSDCRDRLHELGDTLNLFSDVDIKLSTFDIPLSGLDLRLPISDDFLHLVEVIVTDLGGLWLWYVRSGTFFGFTSLLSDGSGIGLEGS
jgi:hypothetical protein